MTKIQYRKADVDGFNVFYREAGPSDGPAVVLLHGFPTSSFMFRDLIPRLADRFHVVAPDHPGFGFSDTPPVADFAYTFDSLADLTAALLHQLGVRRYAMYVHDYGAPIGWRLASKTRRRFWPSSPKTATPTNLASAKPSGSPCGSTGSIRTRRRRPLCAKP